MDDPCGSWQSLQEILPSSNGMWERFRNWDRCAGWQLKQVCETVCFASSRRGDCSDMGLWQSLHARLWRSWAEPVQWIRGPPA